MCAGAQEMQVQGGEEEGRGVDGPVLGACFLVCPSGWFVGFGGRGVSSSSVFFAFPRFFQVPRQCRFIVPSSSAHSTLPSHFSSPIGCGNRSC